MEKKLFYIEDNNLKLNIPRFNQIDLENGVSVQKGMFMAWSAYAVIIKTFETKEQKYTPVTMSLM